MVEQRAGLRVVPATDWASRVQWAEFLEPTRPL